MARKLILPRGELAPILDKIPNDAAWLLEKVYVPLAKKWLKDGATLTLRKSDFVFTLPNGEAVIHFEPYFTRGSGECLNATRTWDISREEYVTVVAPIESVLEDGIAWGIQGKALYSGLLLILQPYIA